MNRIAEYGVAAHALYKDSITPAPAPATPSPRTPNAYGWLRRTIEQLSEGDSPEDFLEKHQAGALPGPGLLLHAQGHADRLPRGATPIDFAYAVHTEVGDTCVGARVNGRNMPLMTELKNGDEVEIIRSKAQVPPAAWEAIVVNGKARSAIRPRHQEAVRKQYSGWNAHSRARLRPRRQASFTRDMLKPVLPRLARKDVDDVLAAVGQGELSSNDVVRAVFPDYKEERTTVPVARARRRAGRRSGTRPACCSRSRAAPPARQRAGKGRSLADPRRARRPSRAFRAGWGGAGRPHRRHLEPGVGITIYPIQSPSLTAYDDEPERWIDVRWDIDEATKERFPAASPSPPSNAPARWRKSRPAAATTPTSIRCPWCEPRRTSRKCCSISRLGSQASQQAAAAVKENQSVGEARRVNG